MRSLLAGVAVGVLCGMGAFAVYKTGRAHTKAEASPAAFGAAASGAAASGPAGVGVLSLPALAARQEAAAGVAHKTYKMDKTDGVRWCPTLAQALADAKAGGRPIAVDFYATWCMPCKILDTSYKQPALQRELRDWIPVKIDVDQAPALQQKYDVSGLPTLVFLSPGGRVVGRQVGFALPRLPYHNDNDVLREVAAITVGAFEHYKAQAYHD